MKNKKRVVVKIGSSSLTTIDGQINHQKLEEHTKAIYKMREAGHEVILVSSGAVAAGFGALGFEERPKALADKQACAAIGQSLLIQHYIKHFAPYQLIPAQILLTKADFLSHQHFQNIYTTINHLLQYGAIPIINENDTVSTDELAYGDNDVLSALVAGFLQADSLIILTDIDGLYDKNPKVHSDAKRYQFVGEITEELYALAGGAGSSVGTGGMYTKLKAVEKAQSFGVETFIGLGEGEDKLLDIIDGKGAGTYFGNHEKHMQRSKQWLAHHAKPQGKLFIDKGAELALCERGHSLLPVGIVKVEGYFKAFDVVEVYNENELLGRGQVEYSAEQLNQVKGLSSDVAKAYAKSHKASAIHRDNWVQLK